MSRNIVEIKQNDPISKDSFQETEKIPDSKLTDPKAKCDAKRIAFISLIIFLIVGLFIFSTYLFLSKNSKKQNLVNDSSLNSREIGKEKRRAAPAPKMLETINDGDSFGLGGISTRSQTTPTPISDSPYETTPTTKPTVTTIVTGNGKNVLLITNYLSKTKNGQGNISPDVLYNILRGITKVTLTVVNAYDTTLDSKGINYLKNFHLVVIDFVDGGFNLASRCPSFTKALMQYIKEGGALFSGHDQFDDTHNRYITQEAVDMLKLLGFIHQNSWGIGGGSIAYFDKTVISNSFFTANQAIDGDSIPISYTHQTYSKYDESCTTCKVIMKFSTSSSNSYEYLVTNRPFKGKTLNIRAGHTIGFSEQEKKIFLSSILWLLYEI